MYDPISEYTSWFQRQMEEHRLERVQDRMDTVLAIYALNLPHDITKQLVISYKYDLKKPKYKRSYNSVIRELRKHHQQQKRLTALSNLHIHTRSLDLRDRLL